jgi:hypothetical protein
MTAVTSYKEELTTIAQKFVDEWVDESDAALTPVFFANIDGTTPIDSNGNKIPFVRLFITNGASEQISLGKPGTNRFRHPGVVTAKIYGLKSVGEMAVLELADTFLEIFRNLDLDGICFQSPYVVRVGETEDGYYQINGLCPFERDSYL